MLQRAIRCLLVGTAVFSYSRAQAQSQGKDYAPFTMIQGYQRTNYVDHRFDQAEFYENNTGKKVRIQGHYIDIQYHTISGDTSGASSIEILKTFESQAKSINAQIVYEPADQGGAFCDGYPVFVARFERHNMPVWVSVTCSVGPTDGQYDVTIVEEHAFP